MRLIDADVLEEQFGISDEDIIAKEIIGNAPTVDAAPVVHGKWRFDDFDGDGKDYTCSVCGWACCSDYDYCPNCGAKMDGGSK